MSADKQARPGGDQGAWGNSRGRNSAGAHCSSQVAAGQGEIAFKTVVTSASTRDGREAIQ